MDTGVLSGSGRFEHIEYDFVISVVKRRLRRRQYGGLHIIGSSNRPISMPFDDVFNGINIVYDHINHHETPFVFDQRRRGLS